MKRTLLVGEGPNEIGTSEARSEGLLHALVRRLAPDTLDIVEKKPWKSIARTTPARKRLHKDEYTVEALAQALREGTWEVAVFVRDRDGERLRESAIEKVLAAHAEVRGLAGGVAVECIESWALALSALHAKPDTLTKARVQELATEAGVHHTAAMASAAETSNLPDARRRSPSLEVWCTRVLTAANQPE